MKFILFINIAIVICIFMVSITQQSNFKIKKLKQDFKQQMLSNLKNQNRFKENFNISEQNSNKSCVSAEGWLRIKSNSFKQDPQLSSQQKNDNQHREFLQNLKFNDQNNQNHQKIPESDAFYFRKSDQKFLFTQTNDQDDNFVLGVNEFTKIEPAEENCIKISNQSPQWPWTLCALKDGSLTHWLANLQDFLNQSDKQKGQDQSQLDKRYLIVPVPSFDCENDWDYLQNGKNWICKCNEGKNQSPVDLPSVKCLESMKKTPIFEYPSIQANKIMFYVKKNILRIKPLESVNLGRITDLDGNIYQVSEVQFHSPSEHHIQGKEFDLEVQVIHRAISGEFKKKAVLSVLYQGQDGFNHPFFDLINPILLPNEGRKQLGNQNIFDNFKFLENNNNSNTNSKQKISFKQIQIPNLQSQNQENTHNLWKSDQFSIYQLLYNVDQLKNPPPFSFYQYQGSFTQPPCEENVLWIIVSTPQNIGQSILSFLKESVKIKNENQGTDFQKLLPQKQLQFLSQPQTFKGNFRVTQQLNDRQIEYYDKVNSCVSENDLIKQQNCNDDKNEVLDQASATNRVNETQTIQNLQKINI